MIKTFNNPDFYPTSVDIIEQMGIDCSGQVILEPQRGKGDIVKWLFDNGATEVLTCELDTNLSKINHPREKFLKYNFFDVKSEEVSHINLIVMNPPFSDAVTHLLHAWNIAPDGCEIISLINWSNLDHDYSKSRRELNRIIEDYGNKVNMGNCFSESERETDVSVGLVKLYKPNNSNNEFEGFFLEEDEQINGENGLMPFNSIYDVVQRYVNSVKCFEEHEALNNRMNGLNSLFDVGNFEFKIGYDNTVTTKEAYKKELQKKAWRYLFKLMKMDKYVTSGVMKDINKFVETQTKVPFTMKNIYKMLEIIVGTRQSTFDKSIVEIIEKFTEHTHENRYAVEGWKTNSGYLLNKKIIVPYIFEMGYYGNITSRSSSNVDKIDDLTKVLCSLTGTNYDLIPRFYSLCNNNESRISPNTWYDWGHFQIKGFKKGTAHIKFKDEKTWESINRAFGKIKGFSLPEKI